MRLMDPRRALLTAGRVLRGGRVRSGPAQRPGVLAEPAEKTAGPGCLPASRSMTWDSFFSCRVSGGPACELLDAAALAGHLIPAGNMFAFPAAHRGGVFPTIMRACSSAGGGPAVAAGHADGGGPDAAGAARLRRPGDRRGGPLRRAVEGGDRVLAGGCGSGPSSLVYWRSRIARSGRPDPGQRPGQEGDRGDRCAEGPAPPGGGLHDPGRPGGHPGHSYPAGGGDPPGHWPRCRI